jgi:pimeloyl-ACP methyl ester carboxylesterase
MPIAEVNGVRLAYDDEGSGDVLILVHGSWTNRRGWDLVAPKLAERFRVVRYDRRGHSESERVGGTLEDDADDMVALAEDLGLGTFHLVCSSRGGVIGLKLAASRPELVRRIVCHEPPLLDIVPAGGPDRREADEVVAGEGRVVEIIETSDHERAARVFVEEVAFGPGTWERLPRFVRKTFVKNAETFAEEFRDPGVYGVDVAALGRFEGPVLLTRSDDSPAWFGVVLNHLDEALPRVERHVYASGGHMPQANVPDEYVHVVGDFLARATR